jgi:ABC-type phosphate/phosphonate transport system substrate-binding protein
MEHRELRTLAVSKAIPSDVLALSVRVSPALAAALSARFEALTRVEVGLRGLLELLGAERLAPFDASKYGWMEDIVREDRTAAAIAARVRREDLA